MELSTMDRPISDNRLLRQKIRKAGAWLGLILFIAGMFFGTRQFFRPKLTRGNFETAVVEMGKVSESIGSTGTLELENRQMILAPATTVLQEIRASPGKMVEKGDTILVLDQTPIVKTLYQKQLELKSMKNRLQKQNLAASIARLEMEHQEELKNVDIERLKSVWKDEQAMLKMGGTPPEKVEQARQALDLAHKELEITRKKNQLQREELRIGVQELELERTKIQQQIDELEIQSAQLWVLAPVPGVVISIEAETGSMIQQNQELVRISDLRTYKITGKIADKFSSQLSSGGKVSIMIDQHQLPGTIGNIRPLVESGQVYFDVFPEQNDHPRFRPNLEVELRILVAEKESVLRVKDGPFFDGSKKLKVFKVEDEQAVAVEVVTGLKNMDYLEIESGLKPGDEVIITDVSVFQHLEKVEIREK
jgi:HlyD family secretion protein